MKKDGIDLDNEYLLISYYLRNRSELNSQIVNQFQNPISKAIALSILKLKERNLDFSLDTLYNFSHREKDFEFKILQNIYDNFIDFSNIDHHKAVLESDYIKNSVAKNLLLDLVAKSQEGDIISTKEVLQSLDKIKQSLMLTMESVPLMDTTDLADYYADVLKERKDGTTRQKSIGFRALDRQLTKPAAPKELTIIASLRGSGKTFFKQTIHNNLIHKNIPIVEFSLEMSTESNMDRTLSMRASIDSFDLVKNMSDELLQKSLRVLEDFKKYKNFLSTDESDLSFDHIDSLLYKAKEIFYKRGFLREDEYIFYSVDLLDMVTDFGESTPTDIKRGMDKWFKINKKHDSHGLGIVQINENKLRNLTFSDPEDIDRYRPNLEDIYGGSAYAQRARTVMILNRPRFLKERFFPDREVEWDFIPDHLECHVAKQNAGKLFLQKFTFDPSIMSIIPLYTQEELKS